MLIIVGVVILVLLSGVIAGTDLTVPAIGKPQKKSVLAVFAHPDDETVTCGGTINYLSRIGAAVTLIVLTSGETGNPEGRPDPALKEIRTREVVRAARILGVSRLIQRDFGDGQLCHRKDELTSYLAETIRDIGPDAILTHDLSGLYGHPDHIACAETLVELRRTRFTDVDLWCATLPTRLIRLMKLVRIIRLEGDLDRQRPSPTLRIFVGRGLGPKIRACYAYRSQRGYFAKGVGRLVPTWFAVSMQQFEYVAEIR